MAGNASVYMADIFSPNPWYSKVDSIISEENQQLLQDIVTRGIELGGDVDIGEFDLSLIDALVAQFDDRLEAIIDTFEQTPLLPPEMPPAPPPKALYNRVMPDAKVLDIGSGDGRKAERAPVVDLILSDKVVGTADRSRKFVQLDAEQPIPEQYTDRITTSNMALCQIRNIEEVSQTDGIHIVPDAEFIKTLGVQSGDGYVEVKSRDQIFRDYDHNFKGYELAPGYLGINTYAKRKIWVEIHKKPYRSTPPMFPKTLDIVNVVDTKATRKFDGIALFFDLDSGDGTVRNRAGLTRKIQTNCPFRVQFMAELVSYKGHEHYILTRLFHYHGFVPWHDIECLEHFLTRVEIDIAGTKLTGPRTADSSLPSDGWIMRRCEVDYRVKEAHTVDLDRESVEKLIVKLDGLCIPHEIKVPETISEYKIVEIEGVFHFKHERFRTDKIKPTSVDTVLHYMGV